MIISKPKFGPAFAKNSKIVLAALSGYTDEEQLKELKTKLETDGKFTVTAADGNNYEITNAMAAVELKTHKTNGIIFFLKIVLEYTPNVIEPSFGIGRILYALLEHSYYVRDGDEQRAVFKFLPSVAPTKALVVPLSKNAEFQPFVKDIVTRLRKIGISNKVDSSSGSIGKRYARNDEVGTPFGITIDFDTIKDNTVTLRERDTTKQIRAGAQEIVEAVDGLVSGTVTWDELVKKYGEFAGP